MKFPYKGKKILILEGYARQCLPFMRAFRKLGCKITLLCNSRLDCGFASRLPHKKILGICDPNRFNESEDYIVDLIKKGNFDLVFPLVDFGAEILSKNKNDLSKYSIICSNDYDVFLSSQNKNNVMYICMENDIPCPYTVFDLNELGGLKFPAIIKPSIGCGGKGFNVINNIDELKDVLNQIKFDDFVIQECIPKTSRLVSCNIFIDKKGEIKSSFIYESKRFYPLDGGTGTFNVTIDRADIHSTCKKLVEIMKLKGCIGIDLMIDSRDDIPKVLEINPRVLACAKIGFDAGINQAKQLLDDIYGNEVELYNSYKTDRRVRMSQIDILWFLKSKNRFKAKPSWFSIYHTKDQTFRFDDPLPWFAFLIRGLRQSKTDERMKKNKKKS